jgi:hypothetical protein
LWAAGTVCKEGSCVQGTQTAAARCDGKGACVASGAPKSCADTGYLCGGTSCKTSCESHVDCTPTHFCENQRCTPRKAPGAVCTRDRECAVGTTCGGRCCKEACGCEPAPPDNVLRNPGFDSDLQGWRLDPAAGGGSWVGPEESGGSCPYSGAVKVQTALTSECQTIAPAKDYIFWFVSRPVASTQSNEGLCKVIVFPRSPCVADQALQTFPALPPEQDQPRTWTPHRTSFKTPPEARSFRVVCSPPTPAYFDNFELYPDPAPPEP